MLDLGVPPGTSTDEFNKALDRMTARLQRLDARIAHVYFRLAQSP